jgi:hypothetical protein
LTHASLLGIIRPTMRFRQCVWRELLALDDNSLERKRLLALQTL